MASTGIEVIRDGASTGPRAELPAFNLRTAAPHLRRPFAANAVRWRVIAGQIVVGYVDARTVIERLNMVVPDLWSTEFEPYGGRVESNLLICHLTIDGLTRSDVGKGPSNETVKGAYSDALKRAGVQFGVGVSLYAMRRIWIDAGDGKTRRDKPTLKKKAKGFEITDDTEKWLRAMYGRWLASDRGQHFGEPLDHGDEPEPAGDPDAALPDPDEGGGLELAAKVAEAEALYGELPGELKRKLPKGRFEAELRAIESQAHAQALIDQITHLQSEAK